jgi:hypothetical protein
MFKMSHLLTNCDILWKHVDFADRRGQLLCSFHGFLLCVNSKHCHSDQAVCAICSVPVITQQCTLSMLCDILVHYVSLFSSKDMLWRLGYRS